MEDHGGGGYYGDHRPWLMDKKACIRVVGRCEQCVPKSPFAVQFVFLVYSVFMSPFTWCNFKYPK